MVPIAYEIKEKTKKVVRVEINTRRPKDKDARAVRETTRAAQSA